MPAVLKIVIVFVGMLAATRARVPLGLAVGLGGVALNLWAGLAPAAAGANLLKAFVSGELWLLIGSMVLIVEIGRYMSEGRNAEEIVAATRRWGGRHGQAASLMALPAVIGLVPMPGGALFSAPFVARTTAGDADADGWKSAVNYWFRHVWEYWWPLYPGVIVAMSVFDMPPWKFMAAQIFFTPAALGAGYWFLVRPHTARLPRHATGETGSNRRALALFAPLAVVIAGVLALPLFLEPLLPALPGHVVKLLAMFLALVAALVIAAVDEWRAGPGSGRGRMFSDLATRKSMSVLTSLAGVLIFKSLLDSSGLLPRASEELMRSGIPAYAAAAALPCLAGVVTGIAVGYTGTSFPLVVGLMDASGGQLTPLATLALAYGFGYMGMMLSPVHLCLLVTRDYFSASLPRIYRHILPCVFTVLAASLALHALFRALGV